MSNNFKGITLKVKKNWKVIIFDFVEGRDQRDRIKIQPELITNTSIKASFNKEGVASFVRPSKKDPLVGKWMRLLAAVQAKETYAKEKRR